VVGGGSTYTPELIDGFARLADQVTITEIVLVDPDQARLAVVGPFSARIMRAYGHPATVRWTSDLDDGLDGAGAVLLQLRIGGQAARHKDETWPHKCGCVGQETTGAGGFAKALRTVPVVLEIAERARARASADAWLIDFTNPVGIVTRALLDAGHRAIGLCNVAIGFQRIFAGMLGVAPERIGLEHVGLNHLTWERAVRLDGTDVLPDLIAAHGDELAAGIELPLSVIEQTHSIPSYYLRYFYAHDRVVAEQLAGPTRAEQVAQIELELLAMYSDPALDRKPELLGQRGGAFYSEAAVALLASLVNDTGDTQVVNVRNNGTMPFLPDDAVIEVASVIGKHGATPLSFAPLSPLMRGLTAHVSAYEELAVQAARRGGRDLVYEAMLAHPLIGQHDQAEQLTDLLLAENASFLPWADGGTGGSGAPATGSGR
ncbi:MAG TPA: 6-phospho-beta-glucosidase, partial [Streptosporangiaceae bacterium]|nr:6-phospho-beta-glucosidase [Streptosporangiaceae bacterium]